MPKKNICLELITCCLKKLNSHSGNKMNRNMNNGVFKWFGRKENIMYQPDWDSMLRSGAFIWFLRISLIISCILLSTIITAENKTPGISASDKMKGKETSDQATPALHFINIEPTVLFVREQEHLLQLVKVSISNDLKVTDVQLIVQVDTWKKSLILGKVPKGESNFDIYVPDISAPTRVEFLLKTGVKIWDRNQFEMQPQRHWEVFMVPISHHDLGYTDAIENIYLRHDRFYDDAIRFCEETADFPNESRYRYTSEVAWSLKHFIENRPKEVVEKIVQYIKEGRIETHAFYGNEITGLCGHEELIRLMYPSFQLKKKYGINVEVGSETDVAGLSWGIPTILAGAGIKYFYGGMPNYGVFFKDDEAAYYLDKNGNDIHQFWDESAVLRYGRQPEAFRWEGPDGESVLFYYGSTGGVGCYGCWRPTSYEDAVKNLPVMLKKMEDNGSQFSVVRYGTYGCYDNEAPDIRPSLIAKEWNSKWAYPKLIVATSSMFFKELEKQCQDVRVFRGELPHTDYVRGVMSTARETSINRITHNKLLTTEKFATIASIVSDYPYPGEKIRQAYENMLLFDEHTWGMANPSGTIQDWNWNDKSHFAMKAAAQTELILNSSLDRIAKSIRINDDDSRIVIFNPLSFTRTDIVRLSGFNRDKPFDIIDEETGQKIPFQTYEINSTRALVPYAGQRYAMGQLNHSELFDLVFLAENVPPLGYKTFRLSPSEKTILNNSGMKIDDKTIENRFYKVLIDSRTGGIKSIYDKELGREMVDPEAPYGLNQFVARSSKTLEQRTIENVKINVGQKGPVCASIIITGGGVGCPQITQEITLYDNVKRIDFANRIIKDYTPLWEIYFAFPFKMENPDFRYEGSNAVVTPLVDQFPGSNTCYYAVQNWAKVSDKKIDITLSPIESHLLEFGGLWPCYISPGMHIAVMPVDRKWINSIPTVFTKGHIYAYVLDNNFRTNFSSAQQGDLLFRYSITTNKCDLKSGKSRDFGWATSNPLVPIIFEGKNEGHLEGNGSFAQIDQPNVLILTMKQAEDEDGIVLRLIETEGQIVDATITLPHLSIKKACLTNLAEENIKEIGFSEHEVTVPVKAFGITTIRLQTN